MRTAAQLTVRQVSQAGSSNTRGSSAKGKDGAACAPAPKTPSRRRDVVLCVVAIAGALLVGWTAYAIRTASFELQAVATGFVAVFSLLAVVELRAAAKPGAVMFERTAPEPFLDSGPVNPMNATDWSNWYSASQSTATPLDD